MSVSRLLCAGFFVGALALGVVSDLRGTPSAPAPAPAPAPTAALPAIPAGVPAQAWAAMRTCSLLPASDYTREQVDAMVRNGYLVDGGELVPPGC